MNPIFYTVLALPLLAGASGGALAQTYAYPAGRESYPPIDQRVYDAGDGRNLQSDNVHYEYAQVVRVDPVFYDARDAVARGQQRCYRRNEYGEVVDDGRGDDRYYDAYGREVTTDRYGDRDSVREVERRNDNGRTIATVVGGIAGAVLGSKIGDGSGRYVGSAVGTMVGGMAGRGIYDANRRARQPRDGVVTVCEPVQDDGRVYRDGGGSRHYGADDRQGGAYGYPDAGGVNAYDVTYRYAGRDYVTRTNHHPGERIRIRVDVRAD